MLSASDITASTLLTMAAVAGDASQQAVVLMSTAAAALRTEGSTIAVVMRSRSCCSMGGELNSPAASAVLSSLMTQRNDADSNRSSSGVST
jgi:hypothetical protein